MTDDESILAVPVGDYQIVVTRDDGAVERVGRFLSVDEAQRWALEYRNSLGLPWCKQWHIERI